MSSKMNHRFAKFVLSGALLGATWNAGAQPGGQPGGPQPGAPGGPGWNQPADFRNLTWEQRQQVQEQVDALMRRLTLRLRLENAGIRDETAQNTIADFADAQEEAMQRLSEKTRELQRALNDNATPPAQLAKLQNDHAAATEDELMRRERALNLLDQKIKFSQQPRLKATLMILGLTSDALALAESGNNQGGFNQGFGGPGFGGPGFGGPGGWRPQ